MRKKLSSKEICENLKILDFNWTIENDKLINNYEFKSFESAIEFINLVAKKCDELDHHPTWENTYNKIRIELNTHDINGISSLDFELANYMNKTFKKIKDDK